MIQLRSLTRTFTSSAGTFRALRGIDADVAAGEFVAVVGRSGSGKSTLLHLVSGIDVPTGGTVQVAGKPIHSLTHDQLAAWRGRHVGIVFQFFQLLPALTVAENVMLPMDFVGAVPASRRQARAMELLERAGVADQARKLPSALSGGQQQRVAIARALANDPPVLLADEPTGNLDSATGAEVFALLASFARTGTTVVVVTHERDTFAGVDRVLTLHDGLVVQP
ncbi:MAG: ABC transporter ATP-binding protein [Candidatus Eisenbacteria bacterium]|nr:ABC transporter ATP-binding protein [Candidatus Eisenbacteria bacterium]